MLKNKRKKENPRQYAYAAFPSIFAFTYRSQASFLASSPISRYLPQVLCICHFLWEENPSPKHLRVPVLFRG